MTSRQAVVLHKFARGGMAKSADKVRSAGRLNDSMLVHMSPREFAEMCSRSAGPTINPDTGLPEFFLDDIMDFIAPAAAAVAPSLFGGLTGGIGEAIGGVFGWTDPELLNIIGSGVLGLGAGALTGDWKTALLSGATGALGGWAADEIGGVPDTRPTPLQALAGGAGGGDGWFSGDKMKGLLTAAGALAALAGSQASKGDDEVPEGWNGSTQPDNGPGTPMQEYTFDRTYQPIPMSELVNYGYPGSEEWEFFDNNVLPYAAGGRAAGGGAGALSQLARYTGSQTPSGGREDDILSRLSNNEYVMDAETVALLGNGSPDEGARQLDQLRQNIRRHKGYALSKGRFSPDAKEPEQYLKGGLAYARAA